MVVVCTVYKDNNAYYTYTPTILLLVKLNITCVAYDCTDMLISTVHPHADT